MPVCDTLTTHRPNQSSNIPQTAIQANPAWSGGLTGCEGKVLQALTLTSHHVGNILLALGCEVRRLTRTAGLATFSGYPSLQHPTARGQRDGTQPAATVCLHTSCQTKAPAVSLLLLFRKHSQLCKQPIKIDLLPALLNQGIPESESLMSLA